MTEIADALLAPVLACRDEEHDRVAAAADRVAEALAAGGRLFTFGAGHSQAVAQEFCNRAGGLTGVLSMSLEDLRTEPRAAHEQLADSEPERLAANGLLLLERYGVSRGDVLVIASNSGRNAASIEMALQARPRGTTTIAILSKEHSDASTSRHPSGRKLADVVDIALDTHVPHGDATYPVARGKVGAASTIAGAFLAQWLAAMAAVRLDGADGGPGIIVSANVGE